MKRPPDFREHELSVLTAWHHQVRQAAKTPWLAALLLRRARRLQQRLAYFQETLRSLPRNWRRKLQKLLAAGLVGAAMMLAFGPTPSVEAATITVDGVCTLANAITAANTDSASGSCPAGSGADVIDLQVNVLLTAALPNITSPITLNANGNTIDGNNTFRVLSVYSGGNLTLNNAVITGGAGIIPSIHVNASTLRVNDSTIYDNHGTRGGGIRAIDSTVVVSRSTISGNSASERGGALYNIAFSGPSTMTVFDSTISGNTATLQGGGIYNSSFGGNSSVLTLNNTTVTGNTAGSRGGGIYNFYSTSTTIVNRSIISGNTGTDGDEISRIGGAVNLSNFNVIGDSSKTTADALYLVTPGASDVTATSNGTTPTALVGILNTTLADNGGPTFTHSVPVSSPAYELVPTTDPNCNPGSSIDQRGAARANGLLQGDSACESGAFEVSSQTPTAIVMREMTTGSGPVHTGFVAAALAGLSAVTLGVYRRLKSNG